MPSDAPTSLACPNIRRADAEGRKRSWKRSISVLVVALTSLVVCLAPGLARAEEESGGQVTTAAVEVTPASDAVAAIKLTDEVTGAPVSGVRFDFANIDLITGASMPIGSAVTDASGVASVGVTSAGRYTAMYADDSSLPARYDSTKLVGIAWQITVTAKNTPGIQLTEDWSLGAAAGLGSTYVKFRDVVAGDGVVTVSGQLKKDLTIPATATYDGNPITLAKADGDGLVLQVDVNTGKIKWATNFPSGAAVYSITQLADGSFAAVTYRSQKIELIDANGAATGEIPIAGTNSKFDIASRANGDLIVADYTYGSSAIYEYSSKGALVATIDLAGKTGGGTGPKAVVAADGSIVTSGGGDSSTAWAGKFELDSTQDWLFSITGNGNSRFNDVIETVENGTTYYMLAGNVNQTSGTIAIAADQTADGVELDLQSSTTTGTPMVIKLDTDGKVVWAKTFYGQTATGGDQEFNAITAETDEEGVITGYSLMGQLVGTVTVAGADNILGQDEAVITSDVNHSDAVIVRFNNKGLYVDNYQYGSGGSDDEFYGCDSTTKKVCAVGNDGTKSIVQLSKTLTSVPTPVIALRLNRWDVITTVNDATGGSMSGSTAVTYEVVADGAMVTKDYTATPATGWYLQSIEVNGTTVASPYTASAYAIDPATIGAITRDTVVKAVFVEGKVPTHTVTFDGQGGSVTAPETVDHGVTATEPADPTRDGYTFDGWYNDATAGMPYDFTTPVTADVTLYAHWTQKVAPTPETPESPASTQTVQPLSDETSPQTGDANHALPLAALMGLDTALMVFGRLARHVD